MLRAANFSLLCTSCTSWKSKTTFVPSVLVCVCACVACGQTSLSSIQCCCHHSMNYGSVWEWQSTAYSQETLFYWIVWFNECVRPSARVCARIWSANLASARPSSSSLSVLTLCCPPTCTVSRHFFSFWQLCDSGKKKREKAAVCTAPLSTYCQRSKLKKNKSAAKNPELTGSRAH